MKRLGFIIFVMLLLPSIAKAEYLEGKDAEQVVLKGKIMAQSWSDSQTHHVRVIYKGRLYGCYSKNEFYEEPHYRDGVCVAPK